MAGVKGGMHSNVATAMAIAGRASRACDVCGSQRARWYCEADNAHLCHRCDQSVHSANALARRHERVRLTPTSQAPGKKSQQQPQTSGSKRTSQTHSRPSSSSLPSRKRSRLSRRPNPHAHAPVAASHPKPRRSHAKVKSEAGADREEPHEVPNFITVNIQESPISFTHDSATAMSMAEFCKERAAAAMAPSVYVDTYEELSSGDSGPDFLVPSGYLDDFESAIGAPIEGTPSDEMDASFSLDLNDEHYEDYPLDFSDIVGGDAFEGDCGETVDDEADAGAAAAVATPEEPAHLEAAAAAAAPAPATGFTFKVKHEYATDNTDIVKKEIAALLRSSEDAKPTPSLLRLNYQDVLSAWSDRSLWTDGKRPQTVPDDSNSEATVQGGNMDVGLVPDLGNQVAPGAFGGDGGREARVMRYREKRRTRLFSKKIRYEVRKLNAERRPRMKGRFVKRTPGCS